MKSFVLILVVIFLSSCAVNKKERICYLSSLENIKIFPANKYDSIQIHKFRLNEAKQIEKAKKNKNPNVVYEICNAILPANFSLGGAHEFRIFLFNNFKLPKNPKKGETRIRVTIGTENKLEKVEILNYTNNTMKKAVMDAFKSKDLHKWESAKMYNIRSKMDFEISFFVE